MFGTHDHVTLWTEYFFDLENCNFVEGTCIGLEARYFVEPYRFWQVYRNRSPLLLEIYWFRIKSIIVCKTVQIYH